MKATSPINNAGYWRKRAEEARSMAKQFGDDAASRQTLDDIAASYDELAKLAEAASASAKPSDPVSLSVPAGAPELRAAGLPSR